MDINTHSLAITSEMLSLIAEIDEFKGAWRAIGRLAPDRLQRLKKVATIESVGSSTRIEGARLSDLEVEALLGRLQTQAFTSRDEQEVAGYAIVMDCVFANHAAIPITENHIKQLHSMLLQHSEKDDRHRGNYKTLSNNVEAFDVDGKSLGIVFETASPFDTPEFMKQIVAWYAQVEEEAEIHPLIRTAVFIVVFLAIHPFQDGNGRLSRAMTTLLLLKAGYGYVPYSSMESIVEQNKEEYYLALRRTQHTLADSSPDWQPWVVFFLRSLASQKRVLEEKVEREKLMQDSLPVLSLTILELVQQHGEVSVSDILLATGAPRGTVKKRFSELLEVGHLRRVGQGRASRYVLA